MASADLWRLRGLRQAWRVRRRPMTRGGADVASVIPCLDVDAGRVVKGVNFVNLRDAGDPVELGAAYDARAPTSWSSST